MTTPTEAYGVAIDALGGDESIDMLLVIDGNPLPVHQIEVRDAIAAAAPSLDKPIVAALLAHDGSPTIAVTDPSGSDRSVPVFAFPEPAAAALGRIGELVRWRARLADPLTEALIDRDRVEAIIHEAMDDGTGDRWLNEDEVAGVCAAAGLQPQATGVAIRGINDPRFGPFVGINDPRFGPFVGTGAAAEIDGRLTNLVMAPLTTADVDALCRSGSISAGPGRQISSQNRDTIARVGALVDEVPEIAEIVVDHAGRVRVRVAPAVSPELWEVRSLRRP